MKQKYRTPLAAMAAALGLVSGSATLADDGTYGQPSWSLESYPDGDKPALDLGPVPLTTMTASRTRIAKPSKVDNLKRSNHSQVSAPSPQSYGSALPMGSPGQPQATVASPYGASSGVGDGASGQLPPGGSGAMPGMPGSGADAGPSAAPGVNLGGATAAPVPGANAPATPDLGAAASGLGGGGGDVSQGAFNMIGDQQPFSPKVQIKAPSPFPTGRPPQIPSSTQQSIPFPTVRGFKIADNQSPRPQDRVFYTFNYYDNLNKAVNAFNQSPVVGIRAYRHVFGFEKTFDEGRGSVGLRLPLNTLTADSTSPRDFATPTTTALGDLNIFGKYILKQNMRTGSLVSSGFSITVPSGSSTFGGSKYVRALHTTELQPFIGYILNFGKFYIQGFTQLDVPVNYRDVTLIYNDIGFGYKIYTNEDTDSFLTGVAPTFEVHSNNPLNHRGPFNPNDAFGAADVLNLTTGMSFQFYGRSNLALGFVTPTTGPKPFNYEVIALFNVYFGRSRTNRNITPPVFLGG